MSNIVDLIEKKIRSVISNIEFVKIVDQSGQHSSHYEKENSYIPSHLIIIIASDFFKDLTILKRHQTVLSILKDEVKVIHSISLKLMDIDQFTAFKNN